ncbi:hypothetical protein Godav_011428 [Gossypium davidsonii]|uniref:Uncharacterized protein n=1 Tax=Gossypium davidsonii TaxID=34287 RepID=A0A7J8R9S9_GOSDV|nr:hypothetical protein [Gossypium davidsonii]
MWSEIHIYELKGLNDELCNQLLESIDYRKLNQVEVRQRSITLSRGQFGNLVTVYNGMYRMICNEELVQEFYANLTKSDATEVLVHKKKKGLSMLGRSFSRKSMCARKKTRSAYFPSLITLLCLRAQVKTKVNLKGPYVQGGITAHDLQRLVENVHELNPTEPEIDESSNKSEIEANSVIEIEKVKSEEEPDNPELIMEPEVSEPREEPNAKELVEPELTIPMPYSSNTVKKLDLSIIMDMKNFMHNQQQAYWKYAKIRDDSVRNTFNNISNNFAPEFPDHIFKAWKEDENASEDETPMEEDDENKSNK